jgi:hypothetical protein
MRAKTVIAVICLIVSAVLLTGCTPEKAEALLTAVKAFELQSNKALSAYESLFKEYRTIKKESQDELFDQAYEAVVKQGVNNVTFDQAVLNVGSLEADRAGTKIENEFQQLKAVYALLSNAYQSLPQGSLLGARYVSCGQMVVAKLTQQLLNFSVDVNRSPLYPNALRQEFAEFKALAMQGAAQKEKTKQKFFSFCAGVTAYEEKHRMAISLTLAAVEQGRKLNELLARYDSVTIANILSVVRYGLSFAGTLEGVDTSEVSKRLNAVKSEMEKEAYWKQVASIPIGSLGKCKIQSNEKED